MRRFIVLSVLIVCACAVSAFAQNKVVFDNQSGEPALVKLIGPTQREVEVPNGAKAGADAAAGRYTIKVKYDNPGKYRYSKGQEFEVTETSTAKSETTITLHKVVAGNYETEPISEQEFGQPIGPGQNTPRKVEPSGTPTGGCTLGELSLMKLPEKNAYGHDQYILKFKDQSKAHNPLEVLLSTDAPALGRSPFGGSNVSLRGPGRYVLVHASKHDSEKPTTNDCIVGDLHLKRLPEKAQDGDGWYVLEFTEAVKASWTFGTCLSADNRAVLIETYKR